ncbi:hypothetical protein [uncultured Nostoc sp.]|uniref:hypothetical protein n=1 Tax=uncultured Nostoc sp. TaxID=340711 RepID=UPI0035CA4B96
MNKQIAAVASFLIGCLAFGYFGSQIASPTVTGAVGGVMLITGAIASVPKHEEE